MMFPDAESGGQKVLLMPPTAKDARIARKILAERQVETHVCSSAAELCNEMADGAGAVLIAEEILLGSLNGVQAQLAKQPAWSDLPLLVLSHPHRPMTEAMRRLQETANVTLISLPIQIDSFVSVVLSRLRDRRRQYTVRKLVDSLQESEMQFRQLADSMPQMVFASGPDGHLDYLNERVEEYFGPGYDLLGDGWLQVVHPDDRARAIERWQRATRSGKNFQIEYRLRNSATGQYRWHLGRALPIRNQTGEIVRWFGTCTDIHEQKNVQAKLNRALDDASAANNAKSEFIANMSHEIRTPMTAVLGYASLLRDKETDPEKIGYLRTIERNGQFLLEIINDILDLSKIEAGKLEIDPVRFEPHSLVYEVHSLMHVRAVEKGLDFSVEFETPVPQSVESDPKRLRQILVNLVGNAIKFTERGCVRIRTRYAQGLLEFDVEDTGIGISAEQQSHLFQAFTQGDASVSRKFGGTGLGLAISQRLAGMLGGEITVSSHPGEGTCFTCSIAVDESADVPLIHPREPGAEAATKTASQDKQLLHCRVLVVDDRRDVRYLAGHFLRKSGATVEFAEDGQQATEIVGQSGTGTGAFDLILMDMQMPRMDGYEASSTIREMGYDKPIIALTADAMQGDMTKCIESGCNAYLSKPIDSVELLKVVAHYTRPGRRNS